MHVFVYIYIYIYNLFDKIERGSGRQISYMLNIPGASDHEHNDDGAILAMRKKNLRQFFRAC